MTRHPAKFSDSILEAIPKLIDGLDIQLVLDPFAGTGKIHQLGLESWGVELEPEWSGLHPRNIIGNALALPFPDDTFDAILTSPTYGNRMADHHNARDTSRRNTYKHALGRDLAPGNSGAMQWGDEYRSFHVAAWREARRVIRPNGYFVLNISDHIRKGQRQRVSAWHVRTLCENGFELLRWRRVATSRLRYGENHATRVDGERLYLFRKTGG